MYIMEKMTKNRYSKWNNGKCMSKKLHFTKNDMYFTLNSTEQSAQQQ